MVIATSNRSFLYGGGGQTDPEMGQSGDREVVMVNTGLSVVVRGHLVSLARDEVHKVATVYARLVGGDGADGGGVGMARRYEDCEDGVLHASDHVPSGDPRTDYREVAEAAQVLASRARRFLGLAWTIVPWSGVVSGAVGV